MEKVFQQFVTRQFELCLRDAAPAFKQVGRRDRLGPSALFEWALTAEVRLFLQLSFAKGRDYFVVNCQWSNKGRFPSEELNDQIRQWARHQRVGDISTVDARVLVRAFPEGWLRLTDVGKVVGKFEVSEPKPPSARLVEAFGTPDGQALLGDVGVSDWKSPVAEPYLTWTIVSGLTELSDADAQYALGGTIDEACQFVRQQYLPLLHSIAQNLNPEDCV